LEQSIATNKQAFEENARLRSDIRNLEQEINDIRDECSKMSRVRQQAFRAIVNQGDYPNGNVLMCSWSRLYELQRKHWLLIYPHAHHVMFRSMMR
jgi:hypothetical protein